MLWIPRFTCHNTLFFAEKHFVFIRFPPQIFNLDFHLIILPRFPTSPYPKKKSTYIQSNKEKKKCYGYSATVTGQAPAAVMAEAMTPVVIEWEKNWRKIVLACSFSLFRYTQSCQSLSLCEKYTWTSNCCLQEFVSGKSEAVPPFMGANAAIKRT